MNNSVSLRTKIKAANQPEPSHRASPPLPPACHAPRRRVPPRARPVRAVLHSVEKQPVSESKKKTATQSSVAPHIPSIKSKQLTTAHAHNFSSGKSHSQILGPLLRPKIKIISNTFLVVEYSCNNIW
jgi:hypothetical protein